MPRISGSSGSSGSGVAGVQNLGTSDDKAIARFDGTTGQYIENSKTLLQDGGAIEAQGFLTRRAITASVSVPNGESWISPELELELTGSIEIELNGELIIV